MRPIKYKAVIKETKEIFPVTTIWFNSVCLDTTDSDYEWDSIVKARNEVVLLQYTGLKDKNGREIYEGDIIEFFHENNTADTAERSEIVYYGDRGYPAFDFNGLRIKEHHFMEVNALSEIVQSGNYYYKVIGNIYEDKHLLEVQT